MHNEESQMNRRRFVTTVASGVAVTLLAGCTEEDTGDTETGGGGTPEDDANGGDTTTEDEGTTEPEGDGGDETTTEGDGGDETTTSQPDIELVDHTMEYDDTMGATVVGTVRNTTDSEMSYMQVQARFFDSEETRVGEGLWNASDVAAGTEVSFETTPAMVDSEPASYEVETSTTL